MTSQQRQFPARSPIPPPPVTHEHVGKMVDTEDGPRFACTRCRQMLTAEEWARNCSGKKEGA